jgi:methyl-accepting chemotaxis protein
MNLLGLFERSVARFIPDTLVNDNDSVRRARLLVGISFIATLCSPVMAMSYVGHKHYLGAAFVMAGMCGYVLIPFIFRRTQSQALCTQILCWVTYLMLNSLIWTTHGIYSTVAQWLCFIPIFSALLLSRRSMLQWFVGVALTAIGYFVAERAGYRFEDHIPPENLGRSELVAVLGAMAVLTFIAYLFETGRIDAFKRIEKAAEEMQTMNVGLRTMKDEVSAQKKNVERAMGESELVRQYLSQCVEYMLESVQRFARGDLMAYLEVQGDDDIAKLYNGYNEALKSVRTMLLHIVEAIEATATTSIEISSNADELLGGAQRQASELASAVDVIGNLANSMQRSAQTALKFSESAQDTAQKSNDAGTIVSQTVEEMNAIERAVAASTDTIEALGRNSAQIGEIVQVINEIADQTNLLALNAAIEAARAGEAGRGFAVVADEVRKLAERTTKATQQITQMVSSIQNDTSHAVGMIHRGAEQVRRGKGLVAQTGELFAEFMQDAAQNAFTYAQLADISRKQSQEIGLISTNIDTLSDVVRESSLGMQHITIAVNDLSRLMQDVRELVTRFRTASMTERIARELAE